MFKVKNKDTRTTSVSFCFFIVNFEQISHIALVFRLLILSFIVDIVVLCLHCLSGVFIVNFKQVSHIVLCLHCRSMLAYRRSVFISLGYLVVGKVL